MILLYTAKEGYAGNDKVVYGVADAKGQVNTYDVTIRVKPAPAPSTSSQINCSNGCFGDWASSCAVGNNSFLAFSNPRIVNPVTTRTAPNSLGASFS